MLDKHTVPLLKLPLNWLAKGLQNKYGWRPDYVTVAGFLIGLCCVAALAFKAYFVALLLLLVNRLFDGLDGELARLNRSTSAGGFLDITLDFIFYAAVPVGFALAEPADNSLAAAVLIACFVGTGASFLAFSSMANKYNIEHPIFGYKGFYYLDGLAEGTETIIIFVLMCLMPNYFSILAYVFAAVCLFTAANRVLFGYLTLKKVTVKDIDTI